MFSLLFLLCVILFFFFKQKTAYEMRISDWSSDVCSSDLLKLFWSDNAATSRSLRSGSVRISEISCHRRGTQHRRNSAETPAPRRAFGDLRDGSDRREIGGGRGILPLPSIPAIKIRV